MPGPEVATLVQGRFKRDGSASAEPEPHGGTGPMNGGSSPQHAQNQGPPAGDGGERSGRPVRRPPRGPRARPPGAEGADGPVRPRPANSPAQLAHLHPSGVAARAPGGRGHLAGRAAHQPVHGRHPAARQHEAADGHDQAGHRAVRRAPGGARPVGRPARARRQGDRLHGQGLPREDRPGDEELPRQLRGDRQQPARTATSRASASTSSSSPASWATWRRSASTRLRRQGQLHADDRGVPPSDRRTCSTSPRTWRRRPATRT